MGQVLLAGHATGMGNKGIHHGIWRSEPLEESQLGRPRRRWKNNIKIYLN
jgi:hypothetical protein